MNEHYDNRDSVEEILCETAEKLKELKISANYVKKIFLASAVAAGDQCYYGKVNYNYQESIDDCIAELQLLKMEYIIKKNREVDE